MRQHGNSEEPSENIVYFCLTFSPSPYLLINTKLFKQPEKRKEKIIKRNGNISELSCVYFDIVIDISPFDKK